MEKKLSLLVFGFSCLYLNAQTFDLGKTTPQSHYNRFNLKKEVLLEKEIQKFDEFKGLILQKIILKDTSDNSTITVFGIMNLQETFETISKKTIVLEKEELKKIISTLENIEQRTRNSPLNETKLKYVSKKGIEIGSNSNEHLKEWNHYINFTSPMKNPYFITFNSKELKDLIQILIKAEKNM